MTARRRPTRAGGRAGEGAATDHVDRLIEGWARERPDLDVTPLAVIHRIGRLAQLLNAEIEPVFTAAGITSGDFAVVANLRRAGPPYRLAQRELMDALGLTSGTVSVRIDRLVEHGIVTREPDPHDGRSSIVSLTAGGVALFDRVAPAHLANEARLAAMWTPAQRAVLADLLRRALVELEQPHRDRGHRDC